MKRTTQNKNAGNGEKTESVLFVFQIFVSWGSKGKREKPKNKPFSFAVSTITLKSQFVAKHNKNKPNLENQSVYL